MDYNQSKTKQNIARTFATLCQDSARYHFMADNAKIEKFHSLSKFLLHLSMQKMAQAKIFYGIMLKNNKKRKDKVNIESGYPFEKQVLSTSLADSYQIEEYEGGNLFPYFQKIALDEGLEEIMQNFKYLSKITIENSLLLKSLSEDFDNQSLYKYSNKTRFICGNCGYSDTLKEGWAHCPFCGHDKGYILLNLPKEI